ncbi:MAG: SIMPL domain-containing protein [Aureispira sp.]|nr:SIMPL domain-containing protein [Aureispira sp.]
MKNIILSLLVILTSYTASTAQASGNINYSNNNAAANRANGNYNYGTTTVINNAFSKARWVDNNTLVIDVDAISNKKADTYLAIFNVQQMGKTAEEADQLLNERYDKFMAEAKRLGIDKKEIYMDMISFVPIYEYEVEKKVFKKNYVEKPKGFEIQQNIHVRFKDGNLISKLVTAAAKSEIYDLVKVDYFVDNTHEVFQDLRTKAVAYINKGVSTFEGLDIQLDSVYRMVTENQGMAFPIERYTNYQAFCSSSIDKKNVTTARKPTTMYYEKIPYNQFEIVEGADMLEPSVQFTYNLQIRFMINRPLYPKANPTKVVTKTVNTKDLIWLTPDGKLQQVPVQ